MRFRAHRPLISFAVTFALMASLSAEPYYRSKEDYLNRQSSVLQLERMVNPNKEIGEASSAILGEPDIGAVWSGATIWMGGLYFPGTETFDQSIAKGKHWRGSNVSDGDYVPVRIIFETGAANQSLCQTFRIDMNYASVGVGTFPGQAWDISDPGNPRRLNMCFLENNALSPANLQWDPNSSFSGKQEFLAIMNSSYDSTGTTYAGYNINSGAPTMDILYAWYPRVVPGHTFFENQPCTLTITPFYIRGIMGVPNDTQIILNWHYIGNESVDHYNIYYGNTLPPNILLEQVSSTTTRFTHSGLTTGLTYYYRMEADNASRSIVGVSKEIAVPAQSVSSNLTLLDFWNERPRYGGCWGYTDSLNGKEYGLLTCRNEGVSIIDLSLNPIDEIAFLPSMTPNTDVKEVKIYRHYIIMIAEYEPAQVFDVSDITNPIKVSEIHHEGGSGAHNCMVDGDFLYIVGNHSVGGLEIFDISDPSSPINTGDYAPFYYHDIDIYKDTLIACGIYGNGMDILDVSDKNIVKFIGHFNYPESGAHNAEFLKGMQYVAIGDEIGSQGNHTRIFDLRDLDNINQVADIIIDSAAIVHNCYARNDSLFIAHYAEGVWMYDVSNPENPTVIGYYDTYISDKNEYGGEGAWTAYPFFASGRVIVSDKSGGLFLLQPTPPPSCCIGIRGDFNGDGTNANVLDLNYCVNRIFRGGALPACLPEGDVNSDGTSTNILDLNFLVNRIFRGGPLPGAC